MSENIQRRQALGHFLRTRRARLTPAEVGLSTNGRRRTPGLRREEVALLANIGISWYTALEQGRDIRPSESILDSLADTLRLGPAERRHLFVLAGYLDPLLDPALDETISPALRRIVCDLEPNPAYILGYCWDFLAWNDLAGELFGITRGLPPYPTNLVWQLFTDPAKRTFYPDWQHVIQNVIGGVRAECENYPGDARLTQLLNDLLESSPEFRQGWQQHNVLAPVERRKNIHHPEIGDLAFEQLTLQVANQPTLKLIVYTPLFDTREKLKRLQVQTVGSPQ